MLIAKRARLLVLGVSIMFGGLQLLAETPKVVTCSQATLTKPELGVAYRGTVTNDDYKFIATIPDGYTGWGGVAPNAPFHGFTIFVDHSLRSCILFEVHLRVDDADGLFHPNSAKSLSLGQARAWQTSNSVNTKEGELRNFKTVFTFEHDGQIYDGQVTLVSPAAEAPNTIRVYDIFLKSVHFGGN